MGEAGVHEGMVMAAAAWEREAAAVRDDLRALERAWMGVVDGVGWESPAARSFRGRAERGRDAAGEIGRAAERLVEEIAGLHDQLQRVRAMQVAS